MSADAPLAEPAMALSDSDSGDSLFQTQHVTTPLRTGRRERSQPVQLPSTALESTTDSEEDCPPQRPWRHLIKYKRNKSIREIRKKHRSSWLAFPFLAKNSEKSEHLPWQKALVVEHGAIGGFFNLMRKEKDRSEDYCSWRTNHRFLYEDGELLPLSDPEQTENSQAGDDIKIVGQNDFILKIQSRVRGHNAWTQRSTQYGEDSMKDRRKAPSNLKNSQVPKVQTRSRVRRHSTTRSTDDGSDNHGVTTENDYVSDTTDESSLSSDTFPQKEGEECTVTGVLDQQRTVTGRKPTRKQRNTHTSSPVFRRSTPLDAETVGNNEEMPDNELQQSPEVIRPEKKMPNRTESLCLPLPIENCDAGISDTSTPARVCEQGSLAGVTEDAIPHMGSKERGDISVKRGKKRRKECSQEEAVDASKEKVVAQTEKVRMKKRRINDPSVAQTGLPENRVSASINKEGMREDEPLANQDTVAEDDAPLTSHDNVHEMRANPAVIVQDEQGHVGDEAGQNAPEKPTDKKPRKRFKGSSQCENERNKAIRERQHVSQEVFLSNEVGLENEGSEELFDSPYGLKSGYGEERSVEKEMTQDLYAQSTTDSQSEKPSAETACRKGEDDLFMRKSSKAERQRHKKARKKDLNVEGAGTTESVSPHKKEIEMLVDLVDLQDDVSEEGRASASVAKLPPHSSSHSYIQTKSKRVISEASIDQTTDIGSYPPKLKDNTDSDMACCDLEERRRRRKKRKRERGEKEEPVSIPRPQEWLPALNSATHEDSDGERYREPVEMPLSSLNDVVKRKRKRQKSGGAEQSAWLGSFMTSCSGSFPGEENAVRQNTAQDQPVAYKSQGERSTTDPEQQLGEHQPKKKKRKTERDSDNGGHRKSTRELSTSTVNLGTSVTDLRLSSELQREGSSETKAGKRHERKQKLVSNYDPAVSKWARTETDRDCRGETTGVQEVSSGVNAIQKSGKVPHGKSRDHSLCDRESHGTLPTVKWRPSKQRLFAIRRFQNVQHSASYIDQILTRNYSIQKKVKGKVKTQHELF